MKKGLKTILLLVVLMVVIGGIQYVWGGGIPLIDDLFTPTTTETVTTLDVTTDTVTTDIVTTDTVTTDTVTTDAVTTLDLGDSPVITLSATTLDVTDPADMNAVLTSLKALATISDTEDGSITAIDSMFDTSLLIIGSAGTYNVTMTVTDTDGNVTTETIAVTIILS